MALGWFIFPYARKVGHAMPARYCTLYDHIDLFEVAREIEILGDRAICKVRGLPGNLTTLATFGNRLPNIGIDDKLNTLTNPQINRIRDAILDAGYPQSEIDQRFPQFRQATFREILQFLRRRRLKPRYDAQTDTIVLDGDIQPTEDTDDLDREITE